MTLPASIAASVDIVIGIAGVSSTSAAVSESESLCAVSVTSVLLRFEGSGGDISRVRLCGKSITTLVDASSMLARTSMFFRSF